MELTNTTPICAAVNISGADENSPRFCQVTAKATFKFDLKGQVEIDSQDPVPIFNKDQETDLGLLPSDELPHPHGTFSVIALSAAYNQSPKEKRVVTLSIGRESRSLLVFGDRRWNEGQQTSPDPYTHMPITYKNAFGGSCNVMLDENTPFTMSWPYNALGKGFDPTLEFEGLKTGLQCADGFPQLPHDYVRTLPNIENPECPIHNTDDAPLPAGWGAVPSGSSLYTMPWLKDYPKEEIEDAEFKSIPRELLYRCHPDWLIEAPELGTPVRLEGITPEEFVQFSLPKIDVFFEYNLGENTGKRSLTPFMLVLLTEEKRFYLVYRFSFEYKFSVGEERSLILRYQEL